MVETATLDSARDEVAKLLFLDWQDLYQKEKPYQIIMSEQPGQLEFRDTNLVFKESPDILISDLRGREDDFSLDQHGFAIRKHASKTTSFTTIEEIETDYLPEVEQLLRREVNGVDRVVFFDWRIRRNERASQIGKEININDRMNHLLPARNAHVDQTAGTVVSRIRKQLEGEADELLKGRVRVINVWRPLYNTVEDWPLVYCDGSTVSLSDLKATDHIRRHHAGEVLYAVHNSAQKWYYLHHQRINEVVLLKNFDSSNGGEVKYCPHASFQQQHVRPGAPIRESIEVRAFVFSKSH